jgi:hypothetical protein
VQVTVSSLLVRCCPESPDSPDARDPQRSKCSLTLPFTIGDIVHCALSWLLYQSSWARHLRYTLKTTGAVARVQPFPC